MKRIFAHIGFSMAVSLIVFNMIKLKYTVAIGIGLAIIFVASLILNKYKKAVAVPLCLGSAILACLIFVITANGSTVPQINLDSSKADCSYYICSLPQETDDGYSYTIKTLTINKDNAPQNITVKLNTDSKIDADPYQVINSTLSFRKMTENAFSSHGYWAKDIFLTATVNKYTPTNVNIKSPMIYILKLQNKIKTTLSTIYGGDIAGLSIAILTGDKSMLSSDTYNDFKLSGATHLMAVSGLHLSVLAGVLFWLFKKLNMPKITANILTMSMVLVYSGVAGFSKSVVRASVMMFILLLSDCFKTKADSLNSLGLAVMLLCFNPYSVTDAGALLSVLAILAIVVLYPAFNNIFKVNHSKILSSTAVSMCICIFNLPVTYLFFGYASLMGIVAGFIFMPIGSIAVVLTMLLCLFSFVNPIMVVFKYLDYGVLYSLLKIVKFSANAPNAIFTFSEYFGIVLAAVMILFAFCFLLNNKKLMKITALISTFIILISCTISYYFQYNIAQILVCENSAIVVKYKDEVTVVGVESKSDYYQVFNYLVSNNCKINDLIVTDSQSIYYSAKLTNCFGCNNFVINDNSNELMCNVDCNNLIVDNTYTDKMDNYTVNYNSKKSNYNVSIDVLSNKIVSSNSSDLAGNIVVANGKCYDENGTIKLSDGTVIYSCYNNTQFNVRRYDKWQKLEKIN